MKRLSLFIATLFLCATLQAQQLKLYAPAASGMVVQQLDEALFRGEAAPRAVVEVETSWTAGETFRCKADGEGRWSIRIATPSGSYTKQTVKISSAGGQCLLEDVLVGEVWIASGQSNMEMPVRGFFNSPVEGAQALIASPAMPDKVRMFMVEKRRSYTPCNDTPGRWLKSEPASRPEMSAVAYLFARKLNEVLDLPIGILCAAYGGARVESWTPREVLESYPDVDLTPEGMDRLRWEYWRPMEMYNAMLHPLVGYPVKGFIWYQGCSNVSAYAQYAERLEHMVAEWRKRWGDSDASLPFYTVEIAPYRYKDPAERGLAAELRSAQHAAVERIPNSGIVVTNDLVPSYEADNIHPARKAPVAERLAYLALNRDYGVSTIACLSPRAVRCERITNGKELAIYFENMPNGTNRWREIEGLEVAGSEGIFYPVSFAYYEWQPRMLVVRSEYVHDPQVVRYGWGDFKPGNLASCEGLPVAPFCLKAE